MQRFLMSFLVLGLMAVSAGTADASQAPAKQGARPTRVERTVERSYGPYPAPVTGCNSALGPYACALITTRSTEAFFTAKVTDAHGLPVYVAVQFCRGGHGTSYGTICGGGAQFCGETSKPIRFPAGAKLYFHVGLTTGWHQTPCPAHSVKTTGTISVTLSNLRPAAVLRSGTIVGGDASVVESEVGSGRGAVLAAGLHRESRQPVAFVGGREIRRLTAGRQPCRPSRRGVDDGEWRPRRPAHRVDAQVARSNDQASPDLQGDPA